jgi:hypothetical protein
LKHQNLGTNLHTLKSLEKNSCTHPKKIIDEKRKIGYLLKKSSQGIEELK